MEKSHILMVKQHNKTGLKYFCYHFGTEKSSVLYQGSGLIWKRHLKKHGNDISTNIVAIDKNHDTIKKFAIEKSIEWDIINSKEFANLILETADATGMHDENTKNKAKINQIIKMKERGGLSEKQKSQLEKLHDSVRGKSMKERCGDDWVNPLKGKSMKERCGDDWVNPLKGKRYTMKEKRGEGWINPKKGKKINEINGDDWKDPRIGRKIRDYKGEGWINPRKGKDNKYYKGDDHINKGKAVRLIVDDEFTKEFVSVVDCSKFTKITVAKLHMLSKIENGYFVKKRNAATKHEYPVNTKIQIIKL